MSETEKQPTKPKRPRNKWTNIFVQVMEYMLRDYKDVVEIHAEKSLHKEPRRIDLLVIKLLEDLVIENTVMRSFKKHNVIEFKGPTDELDFRSFCIALGYFYFYASQKTVNYDEVALILVSVKKPKNLLEILENKLKLRKTSTKAKGIYYIKGGNGFPVIQLVISSELSAKDAKWLNAIRNDWTAKDGVEIANAFDKAEDDKLLEEVIGLLIEPNSEIMELKEVKEVRKRSKKFERVVYNFMKDSELYLKDKQEAAQQAAQQVFALLEQGVPLAEAKRKFLVR